MDPVTDLKGAHTPEDLLLRHLFDAPSPPELRKVYYRMLRNSSVDRCKEFRALGWDAQLRHEQNYLSRLRYRYRTGE
jgi:hypothetical protein